MSIVACGYLQVQSFFCQTLLSRWEFPCHGAGEPLVLGVVFSWTLLFTSIAKLFSYCHQNLRNRRGVPKTASRKCGNCLKDLEGPLTRISGLSAVSVTHMLVWLTWIVLCFAVSGPNSLYAMVKAVPGFIKTSPTLSWCLNTLVASITSVLTIFLLPRSAAHAAKLANAPARVELLGISKLLATFLLSGVVTFSFHEHCFGWWTKFWHPCGHSSAGRSSLNIAMMERVRIKLLETHLGEEHSTEYVFKKADLCDRHGYIQLDRCAHALVNRSDRTLLATLSNLGLTAPALLLFTGRKMDMQDACVLLGFMWEVSILLGPGSPTVLIPLLVIAFVHGSLLLGQINILRDDKYNDDEATIPLRAAAVATLCALLFEFALCYRDSVVFLTLLVSCMGLGCWRSREAARWMFAS